MRIEVTAEDIAEARRTHAEEFACRCPIARAVWRATGAEFGKWGVWSCGPIGTVKTFKIATSYYDRGVRLPDEANSFVRMFDDRQQVEPFAFDVELP